MKTKLLPNGRTTAGYFPVAQVSNLLYRGFPTRQPPERSHGLPPPNGLPIGNRRYSRLETCATAPRAGFTLVELLVVVVVLGILAATIIPQFIGTTHDAKVSTAKTNIAQLANALERFYIHMDRYPSSEEGLSALVEPPSGEENKWRGPYVDMLRPDPWGNPFQYRSPGVRRPSSFDLWSRGADGVDGGEKEGADIGNWL
jgi:general secretion pathway protein G